MRFVVTADESCMHNYNLSFMAGFLSCVPRDRLPERVIAYIEKRFFSEVPNRNGAAEIAILALRKIEACLASQGHEVVVATPQQAVAFDADFYLVSSMDPFGVGPATSTMLGLAGGSMPFNRFFFQRLVGAIRAKHPHAKLLVGGPGAWEFDVFPEEQERLGIDCVFNGAVESAPPEFWTRPLPKQYKPLPTALRPDPFPIRGPSFWGMVEISRGCGRGCNFCDFELMSGFRWLPKEFIVREAELNAASPLVKMVTLLSEDTLRYGTPQGSWKPTGAIVDLVKELRKLGKPLSFTHCCLASALANPKATEAFSYEAGLHERNLGGFQTGIESGSPRIIERYMKGKLLPWKPKDWPEVVEQGMAVLIDNYIIPHATLVMGLAGETTEDTLMTVELVDRLKDYPSLILPLFFVPLSILKERRFLADLMTAEQKELLMVALRHTSHWARKLPNWSGGLGWADRLVFTAGAEYSFGYLEALKQGRERSTAPLVVKALLGGAWHLASNRASELDYLPKRRYPLAEQVLGRQPIVVLNGPGSATSGCGCGMGALSFIAAPALEALAEKQQSVVTHADA